MNALWLKYVAWFSARLPRERLVVAIAAVGGIMFLGYSYAIEPALIRSAKALQELNGMAQTTSLLQQQAKQLLASAQDPDAPLRAELARAETEFATQSERFRAVDRSLITPAAMPALLQSLLKSARGIELVSLRSLPPVSLLPDPGAGASDKKPVAPVSLPETVAANALASASSGLTSAASSANAASAGQLYKHGIELKIAGNYLDLLGYVQALEHEAPNLLWGRLDLKTDHYPRSVMTLTVHTLSLDVSWLSL